MGLKSKIKGWFTEESQLTRHQITPRSARAAGPEATPVEVPEKAKLKGWVRGALAASPWAALVILMVSLFASGPITSAALMYGLTKMAVAVLATVIADATMFNGLPEADSWVGHCRRAAVFIGMCWMLAVV